MSGARSFRLTMDGVDGLKALQCLHTVLAHQRAGVRWLNLRAAEGPRVEVSLEVVDAGDLAAEQLVKRLRREPGVRSVESTRPATTR